VVFLFTDIEGSTTRWETHGAAMRDAVQAHDAIVRACVERHDGYIFKTVGDAFCVAFSSPQQALGTALEAQSALGGGDWSAVGGLRVRMALHIGVTDERDGDYFGAAVNRVARLLSAAHGGQIVVSGVLADTLGTQLAPGVSLRALGTFRLKDLRDPERVFQVLADDLPSFFKPLRTLEAVPNNLPQQTTTFIGREPDIRAILQLLRESTLVTIAGPGGVGKTRTAIQCAAETIDRMSGGAWFVNLAPLTDPWLVVTTILRALQVTSGDEDPLETLVAYLAEREVLLVLDNCEHLLEQSAHTVQTLRASCPRVTILATSREALHVDGERVYRLPPLDASDAFRLFVQRAQAAVPSFSFDDSSAGVIEAICAHLDGIPLAVELAAARVRVLSLDELFQRLSERFRLLTGGSRTALPRQQTLRALIDWSYDLLTDSEKMLFRRVSVFNGGFTLEAATEVCSDDELDEWAILDHVSSLVDKSLVGSSQSSARFYMLESVREYARGRANEAGEALWVAERHAAFYRKIAQRLYSEWDRSPSMRTVTPVLPELDNCRAALHWTIDEQHDPALGADIAAGCAPMFIQLSLLSEGSDWCKRALEHLPKDRPDAQARLEYVLSMLFNNQAAYGPALAAAERSVHLFRATNDERGTIRALSQAAQQYARARKFKRARPLAEEAMERARRSGDAHLFASVTRRCAFSLPPSEIELARSQFADAVGTLRSMDAEEEACQMLEWWAEAEAAAGCFQQAIEIGTQALMCADETAQMHRASNIAGYSLAAGDFEGAQAHTRQALTLAVRAQHALLTAIAIAYLAPIRAREDPHEAARLFGYARARMAALKWRGIASDQCARENIRRLLRERVNGKTLADLFNEGAAWTQDEALAHARF
jgi:predicted ATPase/class 3 adenylate cyclase